MLEVPKWLKLGDGSFPHSLLLTEIDHSLFSVYWLPLFDQVLHFHHQCLAGM